MIRNALIAAAIAGTAVSASNASVFLTFSDPPGGREVEYVAPTAGGNTFGVLTADATVDLEIDLSAVTGNPADVLVFTGASFSHTVNIGEVTVVTPTFFEAGLSNGSFSFFTSGGDLIFNASYDDGGAFIFNAAGGVSTSNPGSALAFNTGAGFVSALPGTLAGDGLVDLEALDSSFTLTALLFSSGLKLVSLDNDNNGVPEFYFNDFEANSAYTGTALLVPAPGAIALAGLAGIAAFRRRR
ncbi:MAG: hypothetical protein ACTS3F_12150 [Phycisphaerales bacterium]